MANKQFTPGLILHEAILGAFKARGSSLNQWCKANRVDPGNARYATFGQSAGPTGRRLLNRIIQSAGPELVEAAYTHRISEEFFKLKENAA